MTANQIAYQKLQEDKRANRAREFETNRANVANEGQKKLDYLETWRSNLAKEAETSRSNIAKETETVRSNRAKETETHRSNVEKEGIDWNKHIDTLLQNRDQFNLKLAQDHAHHIDAQNTTRGGIILKAATDIYGAATKSLK